MKKINIVLNTEKNHSCNCCNAKDHDEDNRLWLVSFKIGIMTQNFRLCDYHLNELKSEINNIDIKDKGIHIEHLKYCSYCGIELKDN
jgi:hypothetical protein